MINDDAVFDAALNAVEVLGSVVGFNNQNSGPRNSPDLQKLARINYHVKFVDNLNLIPDVSENKALSDVIGYAKELFSKEDYVVASEITRSNIDSSMLSNLDNSFYHVGDFYSYGKQNMDHLKKLKILIEGIEEHERSDEFFLEEFSETDIPAGLATARMNIRRASWMDSRKFYKLQEPTKHLVSEVQSLIAGSFEEHIEIATPKDYNRLYQNLSYRLNVAKFFRDAKERGFPIMFPEILDKEEQTMKVSEGYTPHLVARNHIDNIVPNEIVLTPEKNMFILTGPNNGGKTTYIRQVGQTQWLAQKGTPVFAKEAKISVIDGMYSSFTTSDDAGNGHGQYLSELSRISRFILPNGAGFSKTTPYSMLLFDEFANGTSHEEAVYRTRVVLDAISKKSTPTLFSTHKQEIAKMVLENNFSQARNACVEIETTSGQPKPTHNILFDQIGQSHGNVLAEGIGLTPENLEKTMTAELEAGLYRL